MPHWRQREHAGPSALMGMVARKPAPWQTATA